MKKVEFVEIVLLAVLKREITRKDYVIGHKQLRFYPYKEVVTLSFNGVVNEHIMSILSEHFYVCVVDGDVCLSNVRNKDYILDALGINLT